VLAALAATLGLALAIVQGRSRAVVLSEQLAGASRVLADTQTALAEAKTLSAVGEMAAGAAHELNNPLAVISGRAQLMRDRAAGADEKKTWQIIVDQAQRISDIISDLMQFSSPAPPRTAPCDATELLREAAAAFAQSDHPQAGTARVDIESGPGALPVLADRAQMRQVLVELLTNAATAGGARTEIRLSARDEEATGSVLLTVRDNGPGMDEQVLSRVFTPFFSAQQAGRRRGLGLPLARRRVERNGGTIWLKSASGRGTTAFLRLPAAPPGKKEETLDAAP
jgi:signal transduction histidine kinase